MLPSQRWERATCAALGGVHGAEGPLLAALDHRQGLSSRPQGWGGGAASGTKEAVGWEKAAG